MNSGHRLGSVPRSLGLSDRLKTQPFRDSIRPPKTWGFADRDIDFRLSKDFRVFGNASAKRSSNVATVPGCSV